MITLKEEMFSKELVFRLLFHCLRIHIAQIFDMRKNEEEKIAKGYFYQELQKKRLQI